MTREPTGRFDLGGCSYDRNTPTRGHGDAKLPAFLAVSDADAREAMRVLANAGIVSGESGAAGLAGLLVFRNELRLDPDSSVLIISTEGATDPEEYARIVRGKTNVQEGILVGIILTELLMGLDRSGSGRLPPRTRR